MQVVKVKGTASSKKIDILRWVLVIILLVVGITANFYFVAQPLPLRLVGWIILSALLVLIAFQTEQGKIAWKFYKEARIELRKVVWPTRQEAFHMTLLVIAMVIVLSVLLWGIDSFLLWAISKLTG